MERELAVQLHWGLWHCEGSCFHYFMSNVLLEYQNLRLRNRWGFLDTHKNLIWCTGRVSSRLSSQSNDSFSHFSKMSKNIMCLHLHDTALLRLWKWWEQKTKHCGIIMKPQSLQGGGCRGVWMLLDLLYISCCQQGFRVKESINHNIYRNF